MTELPEIPIEEAEVGVRKQPEDQRRPELYPKPDLDIPILPKDLEAIAEKEGIHTWENSIQDPTQRQGGRGCGWRKRSFFYYYSINLSFLNHI